MSNAIRYHTVQPGENLTDVAQTYYGDGHLALAIFQHNRDLIADPNMIYPGQRLCIPHITTRHHHAVC